jgi:hypothetical protein
VAVDTGAIKGTWGMCVVKDNTPRARSVFQIRKPMRAGVVDVEASFGEPVGFGTPFILVPFQVSWDSIFVTTYTSTIAPYIGLGLLRRSRFVVFCRYIVTARRLSRGGILDLPRVPSWADHCLVIGPSCMNLSLCVRVCGRARTNLLNLSASTPTDGNPREWRHKLRSGLLSERLRTSCTSE